MLVEPWVPLPVEPVVPLPVVPLPVELLPALPVVPVVPDPVVPDPEAIFPDEPVLPELLFLLLPLLFEDWLLFPWLLLFPVRLPVLPMLLFPLVPEPVPAEPVLLLLFPEPLVPLVPALPEVPILPPEAFPELMLFPLAPVPMAVPSVG